MSDSNQQLAQVIPLHQVTAKNPTSKYTFAHKLKSIKEMVGGLTNEADNLIDKGFSPEFIFAMDQLHQEIVELNTQRNAAKSLNVTLTKELADKMATINDQYSQAKKRIKLELPREEWPKYGFHDVR